MDRGNKDFVSSFDCVWPYAGFVVDYMIEYLGDGSEDIVDAVVAKARKDVLRVQRTTSISELDSETLLIKTFLMGLANEVNKRIEGQRQFLSSLNKQPKCLASLQEKTRKELLEAEG